MNGPINVNDYPAHLLVLFGNFLLFLLLLLDTFIVLAGLLKGSDEIIESSEKLIALGRSWVLREQATHSVELKQKHKFLSSFQDRGERVCFTVR